MKQFLKDLLSNSDNVSSNRIGFLMMMFCVVMLCIEWIIIAIKGVIWNLPVIEILQQLNVLIGTLTGSSIITKNIGKYFETKNG